MAIIHSDRLFGTNLEELTSNDIVATDDGFWLVKAPPHETNVVLEGFDPENVVVMYSSGSYAGASLRGEIASVEHSTTMVDGEMRNALVVTATSGDNASTLTLVAGAKFDVQCAGQTYPLARLRSMQQETLADFPKARSLPTQSEATAPALGGARGVAHPGMGRESATR